MAFDSTSLWAGRLGGGTAFENYGDAMLLYLSDTSNYRRAESGLRTYLAETSAAVTNSACARERSGLRLRILLSYHYYRDVDLFELFAKYFEKPWPDVFLDSGAYSAESQGAVIDIGAYAEWVKHHASIANVYANLDVIGDPAGTERNQRELERRGLSPLPVFHTGEPWSVLENLCNRYAYVALGGMVGKAKQRAQLQAWIAKAFSIAGERAVFHGFGMTYWGLMCAFPWYSVDSSSWGSGFRFGTVSLFDDNAGKFVKVDLRDKQGAWQHRKLIESYGFGPSDLAIEGQYDRAAICAMSAMAYMRAEAYLRQVHGEVVIPDRGSFRGDAGVAKPVWFAGSDGRNDTAQPSNVQAEVVSPQGGFRDTGLSSREREGCARIL